MAMHNEEAVLAAPANPPLATGSQNDNQINIEDQQLPQKSRKLLPADLAKLDPKRLKQVMANRLYSERYRNKQLYYTMELEKKVESLEVEIMMNNPKIRFYEHHISMIVAENNFLKQKLYVVQGEMMFKQAQYEEMKKEREVLKQYLAVMNPQYAVAFASNPNN